MAEELIPFQYNAQPLEVRQSRGVYTIALPGSTAPRQLVRDVDYGMIRKPNGDPIGRNPSLFKPGAEKIVCMYGLLTHYTLESKVEDIENGFFHYLVRCDLVKIINGSEYVITSSYGSANTREKRNGSQSPYDGANSAMKMAQKRALVGAAISISSVSDMFTQDIESDSADATVYFDSDPEKPITAKQITFFYSAASRSGLTKQGAKDFLSDHGYSSAKEIRQGDLDRLLGDMKKGEANVR